MMIERYLKHKDEEWFEEGWGNVRALRRTFAKCRTVQELIGLVVCVPKFSLWERMLDYYFRGLFLMLGIMLLYKIGVTHKIERECYEIDQDIRGYLMYLYAAIGQ